MECRCDFNSVTLGAPMKSASKTNNFNLIRLLLAISVVFAHTYDFTGRHSPTSWGISVGYFAVQAFFAISGYLIVLSFLRAGSLLEFACHRALRIVPALVPLGIFMVTSWLILRYDPQLDNAPLWTLKWEAACYCLCALAGLLGLLKRQTIPFLVAASWIGYVWFIDDSSYVFRYVVPLLMLFMGGAVIALFEDRIPFKVAGPLSLVVIALILLPSSRQAIIAALSEWTGPLTHAAEYGVAAVPYLIALPVACIFLGNHTRPLIDLRSDLSYGIYIFGFPVQYVVTIVSYWYFQPVTGIPAHFAITMALLLPIAYLSWTFVEKPALSAKRFFMVGAQPVAA